MATVLDLVKHYQHAIEKYTNDEQKVLKSIDKLFHLDVTVQHLQETGVGRTVNGLRKEPGDVGHAARALVYKWKLMVAAEESDQEGDHNTDTTTYNGHENGKDSDENAKQQSKNKCDHYEKSTPNVKSEHKELNGNYSGGKRKYHSSEDDEPDIKKPRGSSGNPRDDYKNKSAVQVKKEYSESEDESGDSGHTRSDDSDSDASQSSREEKKIKIKQEIKQEPTEKHQSSTLRHSSSYKSPSDEKREPSSSKKSHDSEKQSRRPESSESPDKHSSHKSSSKDKSHSSHNQKSSRNKEKSDKSSKSENSSSEKDKKHKENSKSSSKHKSSSDKHKSSSSENGNEKHKSNHEKHSSKSEKHRSSSHSKSEKEKQKGSSEKEISEEKHKSKHSISSKDKHSSSSKERSKDRSGSSKEKADSSSKESHQSHKSDRKHSSASDSKSKHSDSKRKSEKDEEGISDTKSKNKSSSSSHRSKSSSSKSTEDIPKKKNPDHVGGDSDDGIDCGSGASFAEALGMVSPAKPKKKPILTKDSFSTSAINSNDLSPANLLASTAKLAPLPALEISALPEISPNYKPRPPPKLMPHFFSDEDLGTAISSKNQRTKVYSGNKVIGKIPSLYEMCVQILQEHIDALEYTGGVPYDILKPVVDRATPQQLFVLEHYNPYLMEDTDHLWQKFCEKNFRSKQRKEMETWREMYMRCQEEQEHRLKSLTANIRMTQEAKKAPIKQTKMAYVDSAVKPPRNVARKQAQHGTAHAASASPAARVASLAAGPGVLRGGARPSPSVPLSSSLKPKKAPLMQKALQFMRGRKR